MALKIITPRPYSTMPVTLADAKRQARVEDPDDDLEIVRLINTVTDWLAGPNGWLGRSIMKQTLALTVPLPSLDGFTGPQIAPGGWQRDGISGIALPRPPIIAVQKVEMLDGAADATVIAPDTYSTADGVDGLTRLTFHPDFRWPVIARGPTSLRITYDAGYGEEPDKVPNDLQHAILMTVCRLFDDRGSIINQIYREDPMIAAMFDNYRVYS